MTHISLSILRSVGVFACTQQMLVRHRGRFKAQVQVKVLSIHAAAVELV